MKCPLCAAQSRVLATRTSKDGYTVNRAHECFNTHRFSTVQIHKVVFCSAKTPNATAVKTMQRRAALFKRNLEIKKRLANGEPQRDIAQDYGLTISSISLINRERLK